MRPDSLIVPLTRLPSLRFGSRPLPAGGER